MRIYAKQGASVTKYCPYERNKDGIVMKNGKFVIQEGWKYFENTHEAKNYCFDGYVPRGLKDYIDDINSIREKYSVASNPLMAFDSPEPTYSEAIKHYMANAKLFGAAWFGATESERNDFDKLVKLPAPEIEMYLK